MKKKKVSKELLIGLFTLGVLIGSYFGFNYLKNKDVFGNDYTVYATFSQADGLENSAAVIVLGFKIGTVEEVKFDIAKKELNVRMNIKGDYRIPTNSVAKIESSSLLGGKAVVIDLGDDAKSIADNGIVASSQERSLMDTAGEEFATLKENLSVLVDKVNATLDGLNRALSEENTASLSKTMANLEGVSGDLKQLTSSNRQELNQIIENLAVVSKSLGAAAPDLERGVKNLADMSESAPDLAKDAAKSVESLNKILNQISSGEGALGKLVTEEEFYNNLNSTLDNLSILLADLKANPKKYINVSVFGSKK